MILRLLGLPPVQLDYYQKHIN